MHEDQYETDMLQQNNVVEYVKSRLRRFITRSVNRTNNTFDIEVKRIYAYNFRLCIEYIFGNEQLKEKNKSQLFNNLITGSYYFKDIIRINDFSQELLENALKESDELIDQHNIPKEIFKLDILNGLLEEVTMIHNTLSYIGINHIAKYDKRPNIKIFNNELFRNEIYNNFKLKRIYVEEKLINVINYLYRNNTLNNYKDKLIDLYGLNITWALTKEVYHHKISDHIIMSNEDIFNKFFQLVFDMNFNLFNSVDNNGFII